ncbi:hypothetical protein CMI37_26885 [Candidatus Pacearchaeota archaeon]|nr:hypothetical protein [Candidatus Pacearchaeota archaeon]
MEDGDDWVREREGKILSFMGGNKVWVAGLLIIAIILGLYLRTMPMHDHGGRPGLWDITKDDWTLGPDLDPWFFTRYAKTIIEEGSLPEIDMMRNVPLGFETAKATRLLPHLIVWTHSLVNIFGDYSVEFAAAFMPVLMFALTIFAFFFFVREVFIGKGKKSKIKANIIALISTFFMVVMPKLILRTLAGIPEKESAALFFMFAAFYLFLKAWKSESMRGAGVFAVLAGISTGLMALIWGGHSYVFVGLSATIFLAFILNKIKKKEFMIYSIWMFVAFSLMIGFSQRFYLMAMFYLLETFLPILVFFILAVHFIIWKTKISQVGFLEKIAEKKKIPPNIVSLIAAIIFGLLFAAVILGPEFVIDKVQGIQQMIIKPTVGRWDVTVAENIQPYFVELRTSFGPIIKDIPIMFWLFFAGSVVLFKKMLSKIKKKDSLVLAGFYVLFFFGLVFSRYASNSFFNGENFISKSFSFVPALLLFCFLIYYYWKYEKKEHKGFEKISFNYLLLFTFFVLCVFAAKSAMRLIMILEMVAGIFVAYLLVEIFSKWRKLRKGTGKTTMAVIFIGVIVLSLLAFWDSYNTTEDYARNMIPSPYDQQWQKAMSWVRDSTPEDAVFAHWWDYGYWVQSIGERATVLDGGNMITFWNYHMGRLVLTGDNQDDALEFLYNHDTTHLLIDSTDIGKYGAFSSIGSNKDFDRRSRFPRMMVDKSQEQITESGIVRVYQSQGELIDEDLVLSIEGQEVFLPGMRAVIGGVILETVNTGNDSFAIDKAKIVFFYNNKRVVYPLRYVYFNGNFIDLDEGLNGTAYLFGSVFPSGDSIDFNRMGGVLYISQKAMKGFFAQKYLLNDVFNNFPNFKLAYSEPSLIVTDLRNRGLDVGEFNYYQDALWGPIKIWEVAYSGREEFNEEYVSTNPDKYIDWEL